MTAWYERPEQVRASGVGPAYVAEVTSYDFTPFVQQALTECDHFVSNTPRYAGGENQADSRPYMNANIDWSRS